VLGLIVAALAYFIRSNAVHPHLRPEPHEFIGPAAGYLGAFFLCWIWMVHNGLVDLRERVRQAWSLVDVELARRNDLIRNLLSTVEGLRDHERRVHLELAELRTQMFVTIPGKPGPDPRGCVPLARVIAERYPELTADGAFLALQKSLIDTEQRIALAREYFNTIATHYTTRQEVIPDRFIARAAGHRPQPLITAADFERAAVPVRLAS
jgi:hypothetical protein